ncbi:MAG: hypothetical protein PHP98_03775 [Kiritimatiellae bacterium]|nr:hypothetical protein [Kiritimatiellia bacterium]
MMNMRVTCKQRPAVWMLIASLGVFFVFFILRTPPDRLRLLRPIPSDAVLIGAHHKLGARLPELKTNVFLKPVMDSAHFPAANFFQNRMIAGRLAAKTTCWAYVPDFNRTGRPVLVISSWIGGWATLLRWLFWIYCPPDIAPLGVYDGHRLWTIKEPVPFMGHPNFLSFAFHDGVLIASFSRDRGDIAHLMRICDSRGGIVSKWQCRTLKNPPADEIRARMTPRRCPPEQSVWATASLGKLKNDYLAAAVRFEPDFCFDRYLLRNQARAGAAEMCACSPSAAVLLPAALAAEGIKRTISPEWAREIMPLIAPPSGTNEACLLMIFTDDYSGRFGRDPFRIRVPTFLLAVSGVREEKAKTTVTGLLDFINRKYRAGLILNANLPSAGRCPLFAIEATSGGALHSLSAEDCPAFAVYNGWLLLASNSAGLRKLLLKFQTPDVPGSVAAAGNGWLQQAAERQRNAFLWFDPDKGGKAIRFALMAGALAMRADNRPAAGRDPAGVLKAVRVWLEGIGNLENCAVWLETDDNGALVRLELGPGRKKKQPLSGGPGRLAPVR